MLLKLLNITDVKSRFLKDQYKLLQDIIKAHLIRLPFQNITSFGQYKPLDRETPGLRDLITASVCGGGGLCGHLNTSLKFQLDNIGYNVSQLQGEFVRTGIPGSHTLLAVHIPARVSKEKVKRDRSFLVDVGCGIPLTEPIPLDELPFRNRAGGLDFRYEKVDDSTVQRINECGDAIIGKRPAHFKSPQDYTMSLIPTSGFSNEMRSRMGIVYKNIRSVFLHQGMYVFRYLHINNNDDFKIVCIRGTEVTFITKESRESITLKNYNQVRPYLHEYFPMIDKLEIEKAIENYDTPFEECIKQSKNYRPSSST